MTNYEVPGFHQDQHQHEDKYGPGCCEGIGSSCWGSCSFLQGQRWEHNHDKGIILDNDNPDLIINYLKKAGSVIKPLNNEFERMINDILLTNERDFRTSTKTKFLLFRYFYLPFINSNYPKFSLNDFYNITGIGERAYQDMKKKSNIEDAMILFDTGQVIERRVIEKDFLKMEYDSLELKPNISRERSVRSLDNFERKTKNLEYVRGRKTKVFSILDKDQDLKNTILNDFGNLNEMIEIIKTDVELMEMLVQSGFSKKTFDTIFNRKNSYDKNVRQLMKIQSLTNEFNQKIISVYSLDKVNPRHELLHNNLRIAIEYFTNDAWSFYRKSIQWKGDAIDFDSMSDDDIIHYWIHFLPNMIFLIRMLLLSIPKAVDGYLKYVNPDSLN